jgi:hypothetical protein
MNCENRYRKIAFTSYSLGAWACPAALAWAMSKRPITARHGMFPPTGALGPDDWQAVVKSAT